MRIPLYSSTIRRSEMNAVLTCMVEEKVGPGDVALALEKKVCEVFNVSGAVSLRSPAIALSSALKILDLPDNAGVMLSALAPAWQYVQVLRDGYTPVILDVDPKTAVVSPVEIEKGIKNGGRVLVLHEALGHLPNMESILAFGIPVIEDISQSAGAGIVFKDEKSGEPTEEKKAGSFGVFSILGLEEKDILTAGGGAVLMATERRNAILLKRVCGDLPFTDRLPDINAALGLVQLKQMKKNIESRAELNKLFSKSLMVSKHEGFVFYENAINPVYSFPVVLSHGFKDVVKYAKKKQVEVDLAFSGSIAEFLGEKLENCVAADSLLLRTALFPLYPRLGSKKAEMVARILSTLP
ncbi:MAG: aminotransferase [Treponema sp.]|nr:MAG: aminotransferase [Treponema sp.]